MNLALVCSMFDEMDCMLWNVGVSGHHFSQIVVAQSNLVPYEELSQALSTPGCHYLLFENLDKRPPGEIGSKGERFDIGARSMARNFSACCQQLQQTRLWGKEADYVIGITGDTMILHFGGIRGIIGEMEGMGIDIAVSRAIGQEFHKASWSRDEMADPNHPKGGRPQDGTTADFMPQFWIAKAWLIDRLANIKVTNPWCFEQCISDAVGTSKREMFSATAYGFNNGIIYHRPSPSGWKHGV